MKTQLEPLAIEIKKTLISISQNSEDKEHLSHAIEMLALLTRSFRWTRGPEKRILRDEEEGSIDIEP
jgi:hypothetical protein